MQFILYNLDFTMLQFFHIFAKNWTDNIFATLPSDWSCADICRELHKDLRIEYAKYAKVFPLAQTLRVKVPSKWYRRAVGGTEIFSGTYS